MTATWTPRDAGDVASCVQEALEKARTLELVGSASRRGFGRPVSADVVLDLSALSGIVVYEPEELILVVRPGTPMNDVESLLAGHRQHLAFEPPGLHSLWGCDGPGTIGGAVMTGRSGPRRLAAGGVRDYVLGVKGVNGFGERFAAGGRVVKNVTGFDIAKLVAGSFGTLCAVTELTLKVMPEPQASETLAVCGLPDDSAISTINRVLNETSAGVTAAAHLPLAVSRSSGVETVAGSRTAVTLLRFEGFGPAVTAHRARVRQLLNDGASCIALDRVAADSAWAEVREATYFGDSGAPVWRVAVPPRHGAEVGMRLADELGARCFYDLAGAAVWVEVPDATETHAETLRRVVTSVVGSDGHATLVRAAAAARGAVSPFHPLARPVAELTCRLQRQFDPSGLFNPGRMYEAI